MANQEIDAMVKGLIEAQIIQALNNAPEAIEKLVKSVLSKPVDSSGKFDGYGDKMPYLDYMVGNEIRTAATNAARKVIQEHAAGIEAEVRKGLSSESVVAAITKSLIGAADQEWRINVSFEGEKRR